MPTYVTPFYACDNVHINSVLESNDKPAVLLINCIEFLKEA